MGSNQKLRGEKRREHIRQLLQNRSRPITGSALADETGVSRQVIVQDIALLKARNEPIVATPGGYVYLQPTTPETRRHVIACQHDLEDTGRELNILVDNGCKVINVIVEHPIYGEISGSLMLESRADVQQFVRSVHEKKANLLASLTDGVHLHTIEAPNDEYITNACRQLEEEGILLDQDV